MHRPHCRLRRLPELSGVSSGVWLWAMASPPIDGCASAAQSGAYDSVGALSGINSRDFNSCDKNAKSLRLTVCASLEVPMLLDGTAKMTATMTCRSTVLAAA